ncbi:MAG: sn-glycerol-3-phosphate ABC transporter ATP-binding protein UgpC [Prolixibacteraceae bacterium]|nr:sn-glycerol-3-phosphate ABC transporter ATP-binding protein UgpC [Burkholderiales bacterium]
MASLRIEHLFKAYGDEAVVHDISCSIEDGEFIVIVGPSGCGKSTVLRMIAGLEPVSSGKIYIDGRDDTETPAAQRGVAMVFQSYALYPHMTVRENMSFGLKNLKHSKDEIADRVGGAARMLQLDALLDRLPSHLSGGQRQRVAIGRAIVREPKIFLFDEPLSNLDAELRVQMRRELGKLHQRLGSTMIYVTHDQVEAMTLADKIILLNKGRIAQFGTPLEIYNNPHDTFAAGFIGSPRINLIEAEIRLVEGNKVVVESPMGAKFHLSRGRFGAIQPPGKVTLGMRPEHLQLNSQPGYVAIDLTVGLVESLGDSSCIYAALVNGDEFVLKLQGQNDIQNGTRVTAYIAPENILLFDVEGRLISHPDRPAAEAEGPAH